MTSLPDPDWYLDHVLVDAEPGRVEPAVRDPVQLWANWWGKLAGSVPVTTAQHGFVLTPTQLAKIDVTRQSTRTAVRGGRWTSAGWGAIAPIDIRDANPWLVERRRHALTCAAIAGRRAGQVVSDRSAAVLHGLPTFVVPTRAELRASPTTRSGRRATVHIFVGGVGPEEVTSWFGVPVTTVERTVVDLARRDRRDGLMAGDAALRARLLTAANLDAALARAASTPGVRQAREVLGLATPLAESALESLIRLALHDDGFPPPQLQVRIPGTSYRTDMLWPGARLILEVDGLEKYTGAALRREKRREQELRALGYRVERVTWDDLVYRWPQTRRRLLAALGVSS